MADKLSTLQYSALDKTFRCTLGTENDSVVIGDAKSLTEFKPDICFSKWNGEEKLSISYDGLSGLTPTITDGVVKIEGEKEGFYFDRNSDEVFKFGLILNSVPDKSKVVTIDGVEYYQWQFKLTGWENFDFFYQPPLANVNPDGSTWEEIKDNNNVLHHLERPLDINGSYAIYHKEKKNDYSQIGGINYGTGKFGHLTSIVWKDFSENSYRQYLFIENGYYCVRLSKKFADTATYPIKANDTLLGFSGIGGSNDNTGAGLACRTEFASSLDGTASAFKICSWNAGTAHVKLQAYHQEDPYGKVTNGYTGEITVAHTDKPTVDGEWTSGNITAGIVNGSSYELVFDYDAQTYTAYDSGSSNQSAYWTLAYSSFPPETYSLGTGMNIKYSIYISYTAGGGAAAAPTGYMTTNKGFW